MRLYAAFILNLTMFYDCVKNMVRQWLVTFLKLIKFNINKQWVQDVVMRIFFCLK